ncbi:MAG TPA: hypothetical protein VLA04_03065, partial [Verrucomicrobiae bacterium]|nr:hypothetical protein [Verrucomicrobiae bacterium]
MKQFRKLVSGALTLSTAIAFSGLGMVSSAYAAPLTDMNVELGTSTGAVSSQYTIKFTTTSADTLKGIRLAFSNRASGTVTKPDSWAAGSATLTSITKDGGADSGWAIDTTNAATGYLYLLNTTGSAVTQNDFVIVLSTITNP